MFEREKLGSTEMGIIRSGYKSNEKLIKDFAAAISNADSFVRKIYKGNCRITGMKLTQVFLVTCTKPSRHNLVDISKVKWRISKELT